MRIKKMSTKLILAIVSCSILASLIVGGVSLIHSISNIKEEATEKLTYMTAAVQSDLKGKMSLISTATTQMAEVVSNSLQEGASLAGQLTTLDQLTKSYVGSTDAALSAYIEFDPNYTDQKVLGTWWVKSGTAIKQESLLQTPLTEFRTEYKEFLKTAQGTGWTDVYFDKELNKEVLSYIQPIEKDGKIIGIVGFDLDFNVLVSELEAVKIYDTGYAFLLDKNALILSHPTLELGTDLGTLDDGKLKPLSDTMENNESGTYSYKYKGVDKIVSYKKLPNGMVIGLSPSYEEMFAQLAETQLYILVVMAISILIFTAVGFVLSIIIVKPVKRLKDAFDKAAQGDLRVSVPVTSVDEIGQACEEFNHMMSEMQQLVTQVQTGAKTVEEASFTLDRIASATSYAITEIAASIESISQSATDQAGKMENILENSHHLGNEIQMVSTASSEMNQVSQKVSEESQNGLNTLNALVTTTEEKILKSAEIDAAVQASNNSAQEIETILDTVIAIAKQTNLLALNASIEAARAGEHGRGFTIVAEEVKKLAEESTAAVDEVKTYIRTIQVQSAHAVHVMEGIKLIDTQQANLVNSTNGVFLSILNQLKGLIGLIERMDQSSTAMDHHKDQTLENIDNISAVSEEIAASTQEVSAASEESAASVQEMSALVSQLTSLIEGMQSSIKKFHV